MRTLTFAMSPCPNDTFAFHALVHGLVEAPFAIEPHLLDIEELNRQGRRGTFDLSKLSFGVLPAIRDRYRMLRSGAALGRSAGSLRVARTPLTLAEAARGTIAIPGRDTTAALLLQRATPILGALVELRYDRIIDAVASGEVDAGLIIHESRFTYADRGLVAVADLGARWEEWSGLPVPLAAICARADLDDATANAAESAIRASVAYAFANPDASRAWVREHAQEMSEEVCDRHIALYVNDFSIDVGDEGMQAIERLLTPS
jgi:1,4-dihydroxy-6-naphthoate synthase